MMDISEVRIGQLVRYDVMVTSDLVDGTPYRGVDAVVIRVGNTKRVKITYEVVERGRGVSSTSCWVTAAKLSPIKQPDDPRDAELADLRERLAAAERERDGVKGLLWYLMKGNGISSAFYDGCHASIRGDEITITMDAL